MNDNTELKRLSQAATQGVWAHEQNILYFYEDGYTKQLMELYEGDDVDETQQVENAKFIAAANPSAVLTLIAEIDRVKGLQPSFPPRPPEGNGLPRFGLRWNGPSNPLAVSMADGYWTPWHLADQLKAEIDSLTKEADQLHHECARFRKNSERYCWLRDMHIGDDPESINLDSAVKSGLDAAIDAAMSKEAQS